MSATLIASGASTAVGAAFAQVFLIVVSIAVMAPAVAATLFVPLSKRWPSLDRSSVRAGLAAMVLTLLSAFAIWLPMVTAANNIPGFVDQLAAACPYATAVVVGFAFWFQLRHRATFTAPRAAAVASAALIPVGLILLFSLVK